MRSIRGAEQRAPKTLLCVLFSCLQRPNRRIRRFASGCRRRRLPAIAGAGEYARPHDDAKRPWNRTTEFAAKLTALVSPASSCSARRTGPPGSRGRGMLRSRYWALRVPSSPFQRAPFCAIHGGRRRRSVAPKKAARETTCETSEPQKGLAARAAFRRPARVRCTLECLETDHRRRTLPGCLIFTYGSESSFNGALGFVECAGAGLGVLGWDGSDAPNGGFRCFSTGSETGLSLSHLSRSTPSTTSAGVSASCAQAPSELRAKAQGWDGVMTRRRQQEHKRRRGGALAPDNNASVKHPLGALTPRSGHGSPSTHQRVS